MNGLTWIFFACSTQYCTSGKGKGKKKKIHTPKTGFKLSQCSAQKPVCDVTLENWKEERGKLDSIQFTTTQYFRDFISLYFYSHFPIIPTLFSLSSSNYYFLHSSAGDSLWLGDKGKIKQQMCIKSWMWMDQLLKIFQETFSEVNPQLTLFILI